LTARFDGATVAAEDLRVDGGELDRALAELEPELRGAIETAAANVALVAEAQLRADVPVAGLPAGQRVEVIERPVRRAGAYVPGGRAPYLSSVVMCAVTARVAGVEELALCTPPGPDGLLHPALLAACAVTGVTEVFRAGGAQAVAALAYGTETIAPVDVIVGPGSPWVQEAKRQVVGRVGIDGVAGPSELVVVAGADADPELVALDLLAQAEHGEDSLLAVVSSERDLLEAIEAAVEREAPRLPSVRAAPLAVVRVADAAAAVRLADEIAPEHLELVGDEVEALADGVRRAGCLFLGRDGATAFGDYVAGSNHVLPTGGAARHASALSVGTFRRRMARVSFGSGAAARLAPAGAALAAAEGFPVHGASMTRRA
jgi:histidinol dehydrogenase